MAAVKSSRRGAISWNEIAKKVARTPRRVLDRWIQLAKKEDVYKMHGDSFIKSMVPHGMFGDTNDEHLLNPDDFVVCTKKRKGP